MKRVSPNYIGTLNHPPYSPEGKAIIDELRAMARVLNRALKRRDADYRIRVSLRGRQGPKASQIEGYSDFLAQKGRGGWAGPQMIPMRFSTRADVYFYAAPMKPGTGSSSHDLPKKIDASIQAWATLRLTQT